MGFYIYFCVDETQTSRTVDDSKIVQEEVMLTYDTVIQFVNTKKLIKLCLNSNTTCRDK